MLVLCCLSTLWNSSEHRVRVTWGGLGGGFWGWALLPPSGCWPPCTHPLSCVTVIFRGSLCQCLPGLMIFPHQQHRKSNSIEAVQYTYYVTRTRVKLACTGYVHVSLGAEGWHFICLESREKVSTHNFPYVPAWLQVPFWNRSDTQRLILKMDGPGIVSSIWRTLIHC